MVLHNSNTCFILTLLLLIATAATVVHCQQSGGAVGFSASKKTNGGVCVTHENICALLDYACCQWIPPGYRYSVEQCYNRQEYSCELDVASGEACLCPLGHHCCNGACYDPSVHVCTLDQYSSRFGDRIHVMCTTEYNLSCNGACYKSSAQYCCHGSNGGFLSLTPCPSPRG